LGHSGLFRASDFEFGIARLAYCGALAPHNWSNRLIWCEKNALQAALFVVGCYAKSGKDFLKNPDFPA
jgi:hypothetical protein